MAQATLWLHAAWFGIAVCTTAYAQTAPATLPTSAKTAVPAATPQRGSLSAATAPGLNLRLSYETRSVGKDGITRNSHYSDLMYRRPNMVWVERELPVALRESEAHEHLHEKVQGPHAGHAHNAAQGAPLLVERDDASGAVKVQSILHELRRIIEVEPAHYGNAGYGGSWEAAYWMIDPRSLAQMEKLGSPTGGIQRYRLQKGEQVTTVDWHVAGQYPKRIEQTDKHGLSLYRMTAKPVPVPKALPWQSLNTYTRSDYSDLLD